MPKGIKWQKAALFLVVGLLGSLLIAGKGNVRFRNLTLDDGLSQSSVYAITQDMQGFMWFGTLDGLNRYDGYSIQTYHREPGIMTSLSHDWISALAVDKEGFVWVGTNVGGLNRFDPVTQSFKRFKASTGSLVSDRIQVLLVDQSGLLWVGTNEGLQCLDPNTEHLEPIPLFPREKKPIYIETLHEDNQGQLWVGTRNTGLILLDKNREPILHLDTNSARPLRDNHIRSTLVDSQKRVWIGTNSGLHLLSSDRETLQYFEHDKDDPTSLCGNEVRKVFQDSGERVWIATNKGLALWQEEEQSFAVFRHDRAQMQSLVGDNVHDLFEDRSGVLWVGCHGGLSRWNTYASVFSHYNHKPGLPGLSANRVTSFAQDADGDLWVGTLGGLNHMDQQTGEFTHYRDGSADGLRDVRIGSLFVDSRNDLWVGTFRAGLHRYRRDLDTFDQYAHNPNVPTSLAKGPITSLGEDTHDQNLFLTLYRGGVERMDREKGAFKHYRHQPGQPDSLPSDRVIAQYHDKAGFMWLGTEGAGLSRFDLKTETFSNYRHDDEEPRSLSSDTVFAILEDGNGDLWLGTYNGLNRWHAADRRRDQEAFQHYTHRDGLPESLVYGMVQGQEDNELWLSTGKGLVRLNTLTGGIKLFGSIHGLQSEEFNHGAYLRGKNGQVFFGGINGFNAFFPEKVQANPVKPSVTLVDFLLHHESVKPDGRILEKDIQFQDQIRLTYDQSVFSFEFAALHYVDPEKNQYAYKMEGLDEEWVYSDHTKRYASFTTLKSGTYTFRVKGSNNDGVWNEDGASIQIQVLPPPWLSWWAYSLYFLCLAGMLLAYMAYQRRRLAQKQRIIEQLTQVDRLKDSFLANTSHELRTPLGGIIGLAESLVDGAAGPITTRQRNHLQMLISSGRRLSTLVDDILDFSKLRNEHVSLVTRPVNLFGLVDAVLTLTRPMLQGKELELVNNIPENFPAASADEGRLAQILHNLVGNAVKFTTSGTVTVNASIRGGRITVAVTDTGCGIAPKDQEVIFDSFAQVEAANVRHQGGTGLGLAITQSLVALHNGKIWLESEEGKGSTFFFDLAVDSGEAENEETSALLSSARIYAPLSDETEQDEIEYVHNDGREFLILIVDDEPINRQVLKNHLSSPRYQVLESSGGEDALVVLQNHKVDLVLLDIMMPRMSGYTVCKKIREQRNMHALPIIFLTARNQLGDLAKGFACGGNDYLTKPISKQELLARVRTHLTLLELNRNLEERVEERTSQLALANEEMKTLDQIVKTVNREMTLQRVLQVLLEQGMVLFEHAEKAAFVLLSHETNTFNVTASVGHDIGLLREDFSRDELIQRYTQDAEKIERGVYLVKEVPALPGRDLPEPKCLLSMAVTLDGQLEGFLVFSNFSGSDAFDRSDVHKLARFREHAVSAVAKARFLEELQKKNEEIMRTQNQLIMREKMVSLGTLTAGIAHEIKNPLNFINNFGSLNADLVSEGLDLLKHEETQVDPVLKAELIEILSSLGDNGKLIDKHGKKANHIVQSMMMFSREGVGERENYPLNVLVEEYANLAYSGMQARDDKVRISFDRNYEDEIGTMDLVVQSMGRVVLSIVTNAIESVLQKKAEQDSYTPMLWISTKKSDDKVHIVIRDNGMGIPEEIRSKIYTPFFTTKQNESNIGLGLFISYDIVVQEHDGTLTMESETGEGCCFTVSLRLS